MNSPIPTLSDRFGRDVRYLRMSVTDRCDFRCVYCMAEDMRFVPRNQALTLEEMYRIAKAFVQLGVRKIRLTGGEPLVRRGLPELVTQIASLPGLQELAMTSNGARLAPMAAQLRTQGLTSINVSLDTLNPIQFRHMTRTGNVKDVIAGIDAAVTAGFNRIKINAVILRGRNDDQIPALIEFARQRNIDIAFIEEMPLGAIDSHDRALSFVSTDDIRATIEQHYTLSPIYHMGEDGGPSRYFTMTDSNTRVGFISPHSNNFCHLCNRVRLTAEGRLLLCLGNEHSVDLRELLRDSQVSDDDLCQAIVNAMDIKPEKHHFDLNEPVQIVRFMNMTGG